MNNLYLNIYLIKQVENDLKNRGINCNQEDIFFELLLKHHKNKTCKYIKLMYNKKRIFGKKMIHLEKALENFKFETIKINENNKLEIIDLDLKDYINIEGNKITFTIQDGVISENGINGVQVTDIIKYCLQLYKSLDNKFPCTENKETIVFLNQAISSQKKRTIDRLKRNVEGKNEA